MRTRNIVSGVLVLALSGIAIAQDRTNSSGAVEQRLDRIEQAVARLEAKVAGGRSGAMMDGCREMMGGSGMMGGGMRGEGKRTSPNDQWRDSGGKQ